MRVTGALDAAVMDVVMGSSVRCIERLLPWHVGSNVASLMAETQARAEPATEAVEPVGIFVGQAQDEIEASAWHDDARDPKLPARELLGRSRPLELRAPVGSSQRMEGGDDPVRDPLRGSLHEAVCVTCTTNVLTASDVRLSDACHRGQIRCVRTTVRKPDDLNEKSFRWDRASHRLSSPLHRRAFV